MNKNENIGREQDKSAQKLKEKATKIPKQSLIKVHLLQSYISSVYVGCSMPPLNQFLELQLSGDQLIMKLRDIKNEKNSEEDNSEYVYYLERGKIILKRKKDANIDEMNNNRSQLSGLSSKMSSNEGKQKTIQIKENNFFMLTSINTKKNNSVEHYYIDSYQNGELNKCLISKLKINTNFDMNWYMMESEKHLFISSLFRSQNQSISEHKLKGLSRFFKFQTFRRGMIITSESQENQRLCIIKTGECQFTKTFSFKTKNHSDIKVLKIANAGPKAVLETEFILFQFMGLSKNVSIATKAMGELQNKIQNIGFKMYDKNKNNFAVTVLSAYAEIYYISVPKFKELCEKYVPEAPQQLRKNIQSNYITLLRTTKQKLDLELLKLERNDHKNSEQRDILEAKLMSGHLINEGVHNQYESESPIKLKRSEFYETKLQQQTVQKNRSRKLQKKIELILHQKKASVNYKKKIEIVLKEKLSNKRIFDSPVLKNLSGSNQGQQLVQQATYNNQQESPQAKRIQDDLQSIFMNNENNYRSNSIERQNSILSKKQNLLKKRYESMANTLIVHQQFYDKNKNKVFRMDLIRKGAIDPKKQLRQKEKEKERERDKDKQKDSKGLTGTNFTQRLKNNCLEKINKANRIKEQFMTIRSECEKCHCYDDIESYFNTGSQKDIKMQTMKTGSAWRSVDSKTAYDQSLEKLHSKIKIVSEKSSRKYNHNLHLLETKKRFMSGSHRKSSGLI